MSFLETNDAQGDSTSGNRAPEPKENCDHERIHDKIMDTLLQTPKADEEKGEKETVETGKDETIPHEETKNDREVVQAQAESALAYVEQNEDPMIEEFVEKAKEAIPNMGEKAKHLHTTPNDIEKLIEQREYLESLLKEKFTKRMTVMFTDLKGSTAIADAEGDIASRTIMKQHNDVLFPIIKKHDGILVKTMGDGTLSYFEDAQKALRAAVEAQIGFDRYNIEKKPKTLLLVTMGLHTGDGVVEENDIFGDVVNVASRIESASNPGEIYLSEDTYNSLTNKSEIYIRFIKSTTLKGKKGEFRLYKAFWDEKEIELDKFDTKEEEIVVKKRFPFVKVSMMVSIPPMISYLLMLGGVIPNPFIALTASKTELRSLSTDISDEYIKKTSEHTVTIIFDNEE
ncbi:MAG: adenylate/guanylate cyclase domain-containing protein [Candidatus Kuenenia stuttgartiensis]|nr:adenylate/guanylate cyclase domain-containing protein [Candidatus Kuenenia stuttgartiensis]